MTDYINIHGQTFSYLGKNSIIKGDFKFQGLVRIESKMEGDLEMLDNSDLSIEMHGSFIGNIKCHDIEISGLVNGNINATGNITILPQAKVCGEMNAANLIIHPGAQVEMKGHTS